MTRAAGKFTVTGGEETTIHEAPGEVKLTRVAGKQQFAGSITGLGSVDWVFCYRSDGTGSFTGFQRVDGSIDGRAGSLVMASTGDHAGGRSHGTWRVVSGSGTGALAGISGEGSFDAPGGREVDYELEYRIED